MPLTISCKHAYTSHVETLQESFLIPLLILNYSNSRLWWHNVTAALWLSSKPYKDGLVTSHCNTHLWPCSRGNMYCMRISGTELVTQIPKSALLFLTTVYIAFAKSNVQKVNIFWPNLHVWFIIGSWRNKILRKDRKQSAAGSIFEIWRDKLQREFVCVVCLYEDRVTEDIPLAWA